jgi:beta-lactamase regulating signal transducer with metallopeptidase domain
VTSRAGFVGLGIGIAVGILSICAAVTLLDPTCAAGSTAMAGMGRCDASSIVVPRAAAPFVLVLGATVLVGVLVSIALQAVVHHRVSRALRRTATSATLGGHSVGLVPGMSAACVAGIRRPTIYCSEDLANRLDADELRAVLLHERHHQLTHAPARLIALAGMATALARTNPGRTWLEQQRAAIEIAADRHAIGAGAERSALARALLKLDGGAPALSLVGFASAVDLRVRALLDEPKPEPPRRIGPSAMIVAIGACLVAILCLAGSLA